MSVLIKGMAMPETCKRCDFETDELLCDLTGDHTDDARKSRRLESCPLVEVKVPHGNLVDRDTIKANMIPLSFSVQNWIDEVTLDTRIPVVIKAEGAEE